MYGETGLEKLKALNMREVCASTHISMRSLEHIVNKDFEKLNVTKTFGFIRILEKNYDLDLSDWLNEFKAYKELNPPKETQNYAIITDEKKSKLPLILVVIIVACIIAYFTIPLNTKDNKDLESSNQIISQIIGNIEDAKKIEQEPKETIVENNSMRSIEDVPKEEIDNVLNMEINGTVDENITIPAQPTIPNQTKQIDTNRMFNIQTTDSSGVVAKKEEQKQIVQTPTTTENVSANQDTSIQPLKEVELISDKVTLSSKEKVWIGIINTQMNTKKQVNITKDDQILELKDGYLLITGHTYFTINNEGTKYDFKDINPGYFYYKDGVLNKITKEQFKKLNKDTLW